MRSICMCLFLIAAACGIETPASSTATSALDEDCLGDCSTACHQDYLECFNECAGDATCITSCRGIRTRCLNACHHACPL